MKDSGEQRFSLVRLSLLAIAVFMLSVIAVVLALGGVRTSSRQAIEEWRAFADQASAEQRVFRNYVTLAGMAGFMDDYAKIVALGDEEPVGLAYAKGGAALLSISAYPLAGASEEVRKAQALLQANLRAYISRIASVLEMHRSGRPSSEIAAASRVDETGLAEALQTLSRAVMAGAISDAAQAKPKGLLLLDIRQALGLGGLVHYGDAYLAGGDEEDLVRAKASADLIRQALRDYQRHALLIEEVRALADFEETLSELERQIEARSAPVLDTSLAQASLGRIEAFVYSEATAAQNNLQTTLGHIRSRAGGIIILVGAGAVILLAGSVWLLVFRIGRRIKALTRTMHELAGGQLDVDIPSSGDRDEIGQMSRALLVFRDGLRANAALTAELAESSRLASLGALVAGMAHELNTPLGNALAVSSTLEEQCKSLRKDLTSERILRSTLDRHASNLEDAAALIQRNLERAAEQIGSFKQVAVDQTSGRRRQFHVDDILSSVTRSLTPMFKRTPFKLRLGEPCGAVMDSYPGALSQVITNLVENGLRHGLADRPSGKVEVSVRRLGPQVTEIAIADDGVGIPEDIQSSIFNAFFTTKAGKGGSGLGLHIAKSIVCGPLGGQISVISRPNEGARFIITLPNKAPAEKPSAQTTERIYYAAAHDAA